MKRTHLDLRSLCLLVPLGLLAGCNHQGTVRHDSGPKQVLNAPPERGYDVQHYRIDLDVLPEAGRIEGVCTVLLESEVAELGEVVLDLVALDVASVSDDRGNQLEFLHEKGLLSVSLAEPLVMGQELALEVAYGGQPETGLWFAGTRADGSGPNQIFTQGEATHSRGWFPCFDHPSDRVTSEILVTIPSDWVSIAPGVRISSQQEGFLKTDHWRIDESHPTYLTSLVAGEFVVRESSWEGTPLMFVGEPHYEPWFDASFHETDEILSFFSDYTGMRYPYAKYSQAVVDNFPWGGMENISATTLTPLTLDVERGHRDSTSHGLVAHEAAHQWFGDLITCNDWSHIWLNEGFATYMTELYYEHSRGTDTFRARMRDNQESYMKEDVGLQRRPTVSSVYKEPEDLFDAQSYAGAASRLHLLRFLLGDETFRSGVQAYVAEFQNKNVETADFQAVMERVSGQELDTFFEEWFLRGGFPEFEIDWRYDQRKKRVVLDVDQVHYIHDGTASVFHVPVDIEIRDSRGSTIHRIELSSREERFVFPAEEKPYYVQFDKFGWIPKRVEHFGRGPAEWLAVITSDNDVNARREAAQALGRIAAETRSTDASAHEVYVAEVADHLLRDSSPWVRADCARALGAAGGVEARERLVQASGSDPEAKVRVAALEALWNWGPNEELAALGRRRFEEGFSWKTMAAAAGLVVRADPEQAYGWMTERLLTGSPHDELASLLLEQLSAIDDPGVGAQLLRWAQDESLHPTARGVALKELAKQRRARGEHSREIATFLDEENFRLRQAAIDALGTLGDDHAKQAMRDYYPRSKTPRERRAIEKYMALGGAR